MTRRHGAQARGIVQSTILMALAVSLAGCVAAAPTPQPSSTRGGAATPSAAAAESTGATPSAGILATPSSTDASEATATPIAPAPTGPLPSVALAPAGDWKGIQWLAIPTGHSPAVAPPSDDSGWVNATIKGWSGGYVDLVWDPHKRTLTPWMSRDGLSWSSGPRLDTSAWQPYWTAYDKNQLSNRIPNCTPGVTDFEEGAGVLLMSGDLDCGDPGRCMGPEDINNPDTSDQITWTSQDGLAWTRVGTRSNKLWGQWVWRQVSGGSNGFIYLGTRLQISSDGQSWHDGKLPQAGSGSTFGAPVSFAGGYVIPGVVKLEAAPAPTPNACAGQENLPRFQGAVWLSHDGSNWARSELPGVLSSAANVSMEVDRIDDHTLLAQEFGVAGDVPPQWVSRDGRTWLPLTNGRITTSDPRTIIVGREQGLVVLPQGDSNGDQFGVFDSNLQLTRLKQTGTPPPNGQRALGPTGLLVTVDGTRFWLGVATT